MECPYRLAELGWLQFERLCEHVLVAAGCPRELEWIGHADDGRVAVLDGSERLSVGPLALEGPLTVVVLWSPPRLEAPASRLAGRVGRLARELHLLFGDRVVVLSNLASDEIESALRRTRGVSDRSVAVVGELELSALLDGHPEVRAAMPSVLGVRDLGPLIPSIVAARSSFDVQRAQALARVFWPTRAYERARDVLSRHRFVVLTGPPEMGKTAIAQILGLARLTDGWEVHECSSPEALWRVFDSKRRQVFIADDAFGSTEYRPDAAERWAQALGRVLPMLDDRHWLVWTSRPAPLKAGLRRVQRERGSERFPVPGEVLVDASDLDLTEKTLILFRHAKARRGSPVARTLIRSSALTIVEHPHFTPERIRRLITDRIGLLPDLSPDESVREILEAELAMPTDAMRTSYRALADEHRELLIALLDAPAGLIDERELAATTRRHYAGGLSRPPHELIDRLTDHFLRITPLGIGWVHPSWRDLVIDELSGDPDARARFLGACGLHGLMLALSHAGGSGGERALPLLLEDRDWDRLADSLQRHLRECDDRDAGHLLVAMRDTLVAPRGSAQRWELDALATETLSAVARRRTTDHRPMSGFLVEAWYSLNERVRRPVDPPALAWTWAELHPGSLPDRCLDRMELTRLEDWLVLAETLVRHDPPALRALGFYDRDQELIAKLIPALERVHDPDMKALVEGILRRLERLALRRGGAAERALQVVLLTEEDWWVPEDIPSPPSVELVPPGPVDFTREDVARVMIDLD